MLRPTFAPEGSDIYKETQKVTGLYWIRSGECGFVLSARFNNFKFVDIEMGTCFGSLDIIGSLLNIHDTDEDLDHLFNCWNLYE